MPQQHRVFLARFKLAIQDPDVPSPRWHTTLFVETEEDGAGYIHEVNGDIISPQGMKYLPTFQSAPETSEPFFSKELLGFTASPHLEPWRALLESVPAPHQQKAFNIATMRTEPFKTLVPLTFYAAGKERRPLIKCTEWTLDRAIPALKEAGLINESHTESVC
ncbi:hypothetical protein SI65_04385 [Aspergillus cristatus]|uniref:Uncharacterized protein n=1 Tax=Aspergillus cristatus TaxID=573508 RepID=A0A1E3BF34_ASPCR|nr:hypothetical protein SI65_04385 [Aspergillus cristatus]